MAATRKAKTHKGLAKRVKVTANGKVKRRRSGKSHLLSVKSPKRLRRMRQAVVLEGNMAKFVKERLAS